MPNKEDVIAKAREFLEAVAREVQTRFGTNPTVVQQAVWWSAANLNGSQVIVKSSTGASSTLSSGLHEREVFDSFRVNTLYQIDLMRNAFPEQTELHDVITAAGTQAQWIPYGFFVPLVLAWCDLPEPFDLTDPAAEALLGEFAETVVDRTSLTRYRDAIVSIDIHGTPISLEEGVAIRPIDDEELWELGSGTISTPPFSLQLSPTENWCMLDIALSHSQDDAAQIATTLYALREALVANLAIVIAGGFTLLPIGMTTKFGPNATGTTTHGSRMPREFGPFPGIVTVTVDTSARQQLQEMWPSVKSIMQSSSHYLSLPLRRLVDGLSRTRLDDKIVDYAIGLEALLLTASEQNELSYRLALRGATVLGEEGEDKHEAFQNIKDFYKARSTIVHGGSVSKLNLHSLADNGEQLLRRVWNWHLAQNLSRQGAIARIDRRILASEI